MRWPAVVKSEFPLRLDYDRSPHAYVNQRLQIELELLMMSGMPLETCWAVNERWNNKFCYKVASCWLFLQSHTTMHGSMHIKFYYKFASCWLFLLSHTTIHGSMNIKWILQGCTLLVISTECYYDARIHEY